jgi:DNA-binding HxlR family transcriptional regulator
VPPKVEYQLSELGKQLLVHMIPLWTWVVENAGEFRRSREQFDAEQAP